MARVHRAEMKRRSSHELSGLGSCSKYKKLRYPPRVPNPSLKDTAPPPAASIKGNISLKIPKLQFTIVVGCDRFVCQRHSQRDLVL
jgi:hypothetical protein